MSGNHHGHIFSWGNTHSSDSFCISNRSNGDTPFLPIGNCLSYGDSCLLDRGTLLKLTNRNLILFFDQEKGIIEIESGITLDQLLRFIVPRGWFLPVTPGTKFVTIGGAIANDVHGKNHHTDGNFGHHLLEITIRRSAEGTLKCSPTVHSSLFSATIGGLGLTGVILQAKIKLHRICSSLIDVEEIKFNSLNEYFKIDEEAHRWKYTVAWVDTSSQNIRGIYLRGNHCTQGALIPHIAPKFDLKFFLPSITLNNFTLKLLSKLYFLKNIRKISKKSIHYDSFFYPLDFIQNWNRAYGHRGFYQFQCVLPKATASNALDQIFHLCRKNGQYSFLSVLKTFGHAPALGMLSFPCEGVTLCLDFANNGIKTRAHFKELHTLIKKFNGKLYPAKDGLMCADDFIASYPHYEKFQIYCDPDIASSFSRRVHLWPRGKTNNE